MNYPAFRMNNTMMNSPKQPGQSQEKMRELLLEAKSAVNNQKYNH